MRSICLVLFVCLAGLSSAQYIAYKYPQLTGNQSFSGALGMDFDVNQDLYVTALGIFDSGQDGIKNSIDCLLYNRDTKQVVASRFFSPSSQGLGDGTSNFLDLPAAIFLPAGFKGSIVAQGYGVLEKNGNSFGAANTYATSLNTGNGAITFTGQSRHGNFGAFPTTLDLNVAQYGAGNFKFSPITPAPEPASLAALGLGLLAIRKRRK